MFVRIAWRGRASPPTDLRMLRPISSVPRRQCDDLGVPDRDFDRMTRGLFDRQD